MTTTTRNRARAAAAAKFSVLAVLAFCLLASPAPAAESERPPAVTVGDFTFTPPKDLREGPGLGAFSGLWLNEGVDEKGLSPLYHYAFSGRHVQFISMKRDEKKPMPALKAVLRETIDPKDVYSLGDNYGLGIKGDNLSRAWVMFTKDGSFFYLWLYYPCTDVKALAESFTANTPGAEIILAALKSPQVQSWLNFGVLDSNKRMSSRHAVLTVPEGWSYAEKDGIVRITSPDGKRSVTYEPLPDQTLGIESCLAAAKKACEAENGQDFYSEIDEAYFKKGDTEFVRYECQPRPLLRRVISVNRE